MTQHWLFGSVEYERRAALFVKQNSFMSNYFIFAFIYFGNFFICKASSA